MNNDDVQHPDIDLILFDVGGTLVEEAPVGTAVSKLEVRPKPGALEAVKVLGDQFRLGAVTNTSQMKSAEVRALLDRADLAYRLEVIVTSAEVGAEKPDPLPLLRAAELAGVDPSKVLYVGDRVIDRKAALAAGMKFAYSSPNAYEGVVRFLASPSSPFERALLCNTSPFDDARLAAERRQQQLLKPAGSLGRLEFLATQLAAITGFAIPEDPFPASLAVFAADHGVATGDRVTPWPQSVTASMVSAILSGGAAVSAMARESDVRVEVIDVGVNAELPSQYGFYKASVRRGTRDLEHEPALTVEEVKLALDVGAETAERMIAAGARCLLTGEIGIGNTTSAAALIAHFTDSAAGVTTGRGTGINDEMLDRKQSIVATALERVDDESEPIVALAQLGGLEIVALSGFIVAGCSAKIPVIVDGVTTLAALLVANEFSPGVVDGCIAGHRSVEPGASIAMRHLQIEPLLDLDMRLGEGTGAVLAYPVVRSAARLHREMLTFSEVDLNDQP